MGEAKGSTGTQESAGAQVDALAARLASIQAQGKVSARGDEFEPDESLGIAIHETLLAPEAEPAGETARHLLEELLLADRPPEFRFREGKPLPRGPLRRSRRASRSKEVRLDHVARDGGERKSGLWCQPTKPGVGSFGRLPALTDRQSRHSQASGVTPHPQALPPRTIRAGLDPRRLRLDRKSTRLNS